MKTRLQRSSLVLALMFAGCSSPDAPTAAPAHSPPTIDNVFAQPGIEGANCAGAAAVMAAPDGALYPFPSVVAYFYQVLDAYWTDVGDAPDVLQMHVAPEILATSEAFLEWPAKSVQIFQAAGAVGFTYRYYAGMFGFLDPIHSACASALDPVARLLGTLVHVALSQAGVCGHNDDGTTKFWQVNRITLLRLNDRIDATRLISSGQAVAVTHAAADRCILPASGVAAPPPLPVPGHVAPIIPCLIAFRDDAVTEGVVLRVPSTATVAGLELAYRPFAAAGVLPMPNDLDVVRTIVRSDELRAMFAIGVPWFEPAPELGPTYVRVAGLAIGPARTPTSILLPDERAWVDSIARTYNEACCHDQCTAGTAVIGRGIGSDAGIGGDGGVGTDGGIATDGGSATDGGMATDGGNGSDGGSGDCTRTCIPEGQCATASIQEGVVVMVSSVTTKECNGDCPEPASSAPATAPGCAPSP